MMKLRRKLPSILPRLIQSHPDDDEESRCLLGGGKKIAYWGHGWGLAVASQNNRNEKQPMLKITSVLSVIFWFTRKGPGILYLQESVLYDIYKYLPLVDKACLSLTCNRFFGLFATILKEKEFKFPRILHFRFPLLCVTSDKVARSQLLLRLQSLSWVYCGRCFVLHPPEEFCKYSLVDPALQRSCVRHMGVVDICPCASLTIRELGYIVKLLKSPNPPSQTKGPFIFDCTSGTQPNGYVSAGFCFTGRHLYRSLPTTSDYEARVEMIRVSIDSSNNLGMFARYIVCCSSSSANLKARPILHPAFFLDPTCLMC
jgi:hypothetical protein